MLPELSRATTGEPVLVWRHAESVRALSSASVGGGLRQIDWVVNIEVDKAYGRTDLDAHVAEIATDQGLAGSGAGLLTAARVARRTSAAEAGVEVTATVGLSIPIWAAAPTAPPATAPGTINIVVDMPVRCADATLVNLVMTVTEAKTQALFDAGIDGTGTASDAVVVTCPLGGPEVRFGGPRSEWGQRVARATHQAVLQGARP